MFATRNLQRHCFKTLSPLLQSNPFRDVVLLKDFAPKVSSVNLGQPSCSFEDSFPLFSPLDHPFSSGWRRAMSTSRGPSRGRGSSMRSKVEKRMQRETGKTLREIRRAKKLKMKLMTDEERLIYNLKRAKKKVALLLQKLKKYELPEPPTPVHDPEPLTPEQIQAYKKIGFKNKNYVPVGVRGVFGGVVQNMHMHWKFHETVQVCCDNFPKEKIKEMASILARLSGGIVINIHNVKTIIMFRGRNYRQPKNLIPINTLTKRKALFKARFEQALESQKLNIKKLEQQLRRMGVNPEDPVAMASIRRVASTFFNAIDQTDGSPYVFHGDKQPMADPSASLEHSEPQADSDQEELDRFIAEIEDAADKEWAAEEEAEKEEYGRIRYWNREEFGGRIRYRSEASDDDVRGERHWKEAHDKHKNAGRDDDSDIRYGDHDLDFDDARDASDLETNVIYSDKAHNDRLRSRDTQRNPNRNGWNDNTEIYRRKTEAKFLRRKAEETSESENMLSDLDNTMWESDTEEKGDFPGSRSEAGHNFRSSSDDEEDIYTGKINEKIKVNDSGSDQGELKISPRSFMSKGEANTRRKMAQEDSGSEDAFSDSEIAAFKSDAEEDEGEYSEEEDDYRDSAEYNDDYDLKQIQKHEVNHGKNNMRSPKDKDESWDSD